jgi:N-acetylneuraminate synthase
MTDVIHIAGRAIGKGQPPYIMAELSGNHNGDIERAVRLINAAKDAGADAVKLQTYTADTITIDHAGPGFVIEGGLWHGRKLYELYREAHTPWDWHPTLFDHARKIGITCFSSPFDLTAIDLLERLGAPAYKIASFEIVDTPLIRYAAKTGKPLIISTGMASAAEINDAVVAAREAGGIVLLHCVSGYPTPAEEANLSRIPALAAKFDIPIGLSDHTLGIEVAIASVALGAAVIEKHVTLARADGGPDAAFSLEPHELAALVKGAKTAHAALGRADYGRAASEKGSMAFRRSLYVVKDIQAGECFTADNVRSIRPGFGLPPGELPNILGRRAARAVARGTPMSAELLAEDEHRMREGRATT